MDIRIYRAAFLPALLALVVVMFSLQDRPPPLSSTLAPDAFDAKGAYATLEEIVRRQPDRRPGSQGNRALAALVEGRLQSLAGFETARDEFKAEVEGDDVGMVNVTGVLAGLSDRQFVILAHRDSLRRPGASTASSTAVLLELAKALAGVRHNKTLVFVSTDGGQADSAGARRFAEAYPNRENLDGLLVLDDVGAARTRMPYLQSWSSDTQRGSVQLFATADAALRREIGSGAGSESVPGQFVRQAWPLTLREQGPLVDRGLDALTLTARGEVPRGPAGDTIDRISRLRLLDFGKAALATVLALDAGQRLESSPPSYLVSDRKYIPGWSISLLALALLAPAVATTLDSFARARRRGRPIGRWLRWALAAGVPFLLTLAAAYAFELLDWLPATASEALAPASRPSFTEAAPPLGALTLVFVLGWLVARPVVIGPRAELGRPDRPETAVALCLALSVELLLLWLSNPFAALLMVPVLHLCLLLALTDGSRRSSLAALTIIAALLLPAVVLLYYGVRLDLGFDPTRYALLLVAGGGSLWSIVLAAALAGSLVSVVATALARRERGREPEITVRGPKTYAGPGSLGGTESALRR